MQNHPKKERKKHASYCCAKNTLRASVLYRRSSIKDYRIHRD